MSGLRTASFECLGTSQGSSLCSKCGLQRVRAHGDHCRACTDQDEQQFKQEWQNRRISNPIPAEVRKAVLARVRADPGTQFGVCECCWVKDHLELHHRTYSRIVMGEEDYIFGHETEEDLRALCRECHHAQHIDPFGGFWMDPEEMANYFAPHFEPDGCGGWEMDDD